MDSIVGWLGLFIGVAGIVISVWDIRQRRREQRPSSPIPAPELTRSTQSQEMVLLSFDPKRRATPGTLEHHAFALRDAMPWSFTKDTFIDHPLGNVLGSRHLLMNLYVASGLFAFFFLSLAISVVVGLLAGTIDWTRAGLAILLAGPISFYAGRALWRTVKLARKGLAVSEEH